jgi:hypothetical protein
MKTALRSFLALLAFCVALGACSSPFESTDVEIATWEIGEQKVPCMGMVPTTCMLYRENGSAEWTPLIEQIGGFTYQAGFRYRVEVEIREVRNPPADGSSVTIRLLRLIEKRAVAADL